MEGERTIGYYKCRHCNELFVPTFGAYTMVTWRAGTEYNQKKVKFPSDTSVIGKILSVKCEIVKDNLPIESEILPLELTEQEVLYGRKIGYKE